jgi:hypothetical protein
MKATGGIGARSVWIAGRKARKSGVGYRQLYSRKQAHGVSRQRRTSSS